MIDRRQMLVKIGRALYCSPWLLAGCNTPPKRQQFPEITYQHLPPFRLDVAAIEIAALYDPTANAEDVGGEFPEAPIKALRNWMDDRFRAIGAAGKGILTIIDASAINKPLPRSPALSAVDLSDEYQLTFEVKLEVENPNLQRNAHVTAKATRTQTIREDMTINQREGVLFSLLDMSLKNLNAEFDRLMPRYMADFLRPDAG